jgi:hypothetical protein
VYTCSSTTLFRFLSIAGRSLVLAGRTTMAGPDFTALTWLPTSVLAICSCGKGQSSSPDPCSVRCADSEGRTSGSRGGCAPCFPPSFEPPCRNCSISVHSSQKPSLNTSVAHSRLHGHQVPKVSYKPKKNRLQVCAGERSPR